FLVYANGKTYKKANRKNVKQQDSDTNSTSLSHKSAPHRSSLSDDYSLIAAEVARLINPVIETTIGKAIDKLQIKISDISGKLSTHDKRFREIEDAVSQIQDKTIDSLSRIDSLEKQNYSLFLSQKRKEFSQTCQSLANQYINFSLMYPARLKIFLPSGAIVFSNPGEASTFTSHLEKKSIGNFVSETTSNSRFSSPPKDQRWKKYEKPRQSKFSNDSLQAGSRSRSRSPLPPRTSNPPHS
ncbi:hypothetical protein XELAEV_18002936mg, partial [Xenopus laevis]